MVGIPVLYFYYFPLLKEYLSREDLNKGIESRFFTTVPAGAVIVIKKGDTPVKYIGNISGKDVNPDTGEIFQKNDPNKPVFTPASNKGFVWMNLYPMYRKHTYNHSWVKYAIKDKTTMKYEFISRDESVSQIKALYPYAVRVSECETSNGIAIDMDLVIGVELTHAGVALFGSSNYLALLTGRVSDVVREYVGRRSLDDVTKETKAETKNEVALDDLIGGILSINEDHSSEGGNPSITSTTGVRINSVNFIGYQLAPSFEAVKKARIDLDAAKVQTDIAEEGFKKAKKDADGEAYREETVGKAKNKPKIELANAMKENPHAKTILIANALENTKIKTLVLGDKSTNILLDGKDDNNA
jgi:regulator of protease activity HflC (stomatin/prohibitin superfamily)